MSITELIEQLKAMPEKMEGFNSDCELVVINTNKFAEKLKKSLRNCDVGTAEEQIVRHKKWCESYKCHPLTPCRECYAKWAQMPYEEGGVK